MKRLIVLAAMLLAGCQTTTPLEGADIRYSLPRTDAKANLTLTLKDCRTLAVESDLNVAPASGAQDTVVKIPALALASARIKRSLTIGLNDKGAIKSVSSTTSDRTPQIVGNYVNAAAKLAVLAVAAAPGAKPNCTAATAAAVERAAGIRSRIDSLRAALNAPAPAPVAGKPRPEPVTDLDRRRMKDLALLTKELGALDPLLKIDTSATLKLDPKQIGPSPSDRRAGDTLTYEASSNNLKAELDTDPFKKWFDNVSDDNIASYFGLTWGAKVLDRPSERALSVNTHMDKPGLRTCGLAIPVPDPRKVEVQVAGSGTQVREAKAKKVLAAAQFNDGKEICIDVGFGETRSLALTFDEFGQTTEYTWTSEATGEAVSGLVAGSAESAATLVKTARGKSDLDKQKAEIDELTTEKTLSDLRACKAIRDAGGTCPPAE